jgi:hypothetical protein
MFYMYTMLGELYDIDTESVQFFLGGDVSS